MAPDLLVLSRVSYRGREISGPLLRTLLALLAADLHTGCTASRLVEALWPDERPEHPRKALQILVSRLRARLGAEVIARTPAGYRLTLPPEQVDAAALARHAAASARHAAAGDQVASLDAAEAGLLLWNGVSPGHIPPDARHDLERIFAGLVRSRALALARSGRAADALDPLIALAEAPRAGDVVHGPAESAPTADEEILLELLRAEAAVTGPAAALARYDAYRRALRAETGTEPGPRLRALYRTLLDDQAPRIRHHVADEPNPLLGRDHDLAALVELVGTARVTSVVGPGGLGKTRLAHAVGRRAPQRVVHFVPLAGVASPDDVLDAVASALGGGESPLWARRRDLAAVLGSGPTLLILDNCEHVLDAVADLVHALLPGAPQLRVLVTSRAPLRLSAESVYHLAELDPGTAVELFGMRARAARPGVELPAETVRELCGRLDGLPLAIELAAARVRVMSVVEIVRRLDDRFALLRGGPRDAPQRHRTLHAVVDWSWALLAPAERAAMRTLSIFPAGFTADMAPVSYDVLERLVDQSMLKVTDTPLGARFTMLETVREFAAAHRDGSGAELLRGWARGFGTTFHGELFGPRAFAVAARVRAEQDNLVQALRHALARDDGATTAAVTAVLAGLWITDAAYTRVITLRAETERLLSHYRPAPEYVDAARAAAALCAITTFMLYGARATRSLVVLRRLPPARPDSPLGALAALMRALPGLDAAGLDALCDSDAPLLAGLANGLTTYTRVANDDWPGALAAARRMLAAFADGPGPWVRILAHSRMAELSMQLDRGAEAKEHLLAALRAMGEGPDANQLRWNLVLACIHLGQGDEAEYWLRTAEREAADPAHGLRAFEHGIRAELHLFRGEVEEGLRWWRRALADVLAAGPAGVAPWGLEVLAAAVVAHGRHDRLDAVRDVAALLPRLLRTLLAQPPGGPSPTLTEFPLIGTVLVALAYAEADPGGRARLLAMAERLRYQRSFVSPAAVRRAVAKADGPTHADAASRYSALDHRDLRAAVSFLVERHERSRLNDRLAQA
ncbi:ATP-binding protein [Virgisporangium aliadipatigenens]|uniref:ATP-binding protein n=1 Tax=Virgisporangium aliadipatigenens TaxID=741659 RepID=UPI001940C34E|nr:BTAD domain-containing putative transcriptional regulator [Virgisporangium aliadipatigenens]